MSLAASEPLETVLIYARVSHDPKYKGESVDRQIKLGREWIESNGYALSGTPIRDDNRSASSFATKRREGWEQVKAILAKGTVDILWTWEDTRATREMPEYLILAGLCKQYNVRWAFKGRVYDLNDSDDEFFVALGILMAAREVKKTSERVSGAMASRASLGKIHGRVPYGYRREYEVGDDGERIVRQIPDPVTAPLVREMAARFLNGESLRSIAKDFESRRIPTSTGKDRWGWENYMIRRILSNPAIAGKRKHKGKIVADGKWDEIIDEVTFARLQARFGDPTRKTIKQRESSNLLTGVARCGLCDGPMGFAAKVYADGTERFQYACRKCQRTSRYQKPLELMVTAWLVNYMERSNIGVDDGPSPELLKIREKRDELSRKLNDLPKLLLLDDKFDALDYAAATTVLRDEINRLDQSIKVANIPTVAVDMAASDDPEAYWRRLGETETGRELQREILRSMVRVVVHPSSNRGSHRFDPTTIEITPRF